MAASLPEALRARLEALAVGKSRTVLAARSEAISERYRSFGPSAGSISTADDVLAYAMSRMPATYAAVSHVLDAAAERLNGFAPESLLDAGAGPGTASWAAVTHWPGIVAATLMDRSPDFLGLAGELVGGDGIFANAEVIRGDLVRTGLEDRKFDLVMASYALTELPVDAIVMAATALWRHTAGVLVIVEPGRPRDYERLMRIRTPLLADGAQIVAPCPHANACPLPEGDWCHFVERLPRSRDHMRMKGGVLPYEDEKFSYLVLARPEVALSSSASRIIAPVERSKFAVELPLCTKRGLERVQVMKRDPVGFRIARKAEWGDSWR